MATLKRRLHRKNSSGGYDIVYLQTSSDLVLMSDGSTTLTSKISSMDTAINGKAAASHGTHVTFSTAAPAMNGTAAVGSATTVARSDHVHPVDTSRAAASHNHDAANITSGTLAVARGGTGVTSLDALKSALGVGGGSGTPSSLTKPSVGSVGSTLTWAGYTWRVVHDDGKLVYLITEAVLENIAFSSRNSNGFLGSTIHQRCLKFAADTDISNCAFVADIMGGKAFIAGVDQLFDGFSYFSSDSARIGKLNGSATEWWISSSINGSGSYYVNTSGKLSSGGFQLYDASGFRPCVALIK